MTPSAQVNAQLQLEELDLERLAARCPAISQYRLRRPLSILDSGNLALALMPVVPEKQRIGWIGGSMLRLIVSSK